MSAREEYEDALAQYRAAQARLIEAKRHFDPGQTPEAIAQRRAKQAEYRAKRRAEHNTPEARAALERWLQELANIGQCAIEQAENMPDELRILTRSGER